MTATNNTGTIGNKRTKLATGQPPVIDSVCFELLFKKYTLIDIRDSYINFPFQPCHFVVIYQIYAPQNQH